MLDCFAPLPHLLRMLIEPALHLIENVLIHPSGDPPFFALGAAALDGAVRTCVGPIAAQDQSIFLGRVAVGELLTGRTNVNILCGHVAEVLLAVAPLCL